MRTIDFSPLFRSTVGFDRMERLMDAAMNADQGNGYPPYNIEVHGEDSYRITMAVAGFTEADLDIVGKENTLTISGAIKPKETDEKVETHFLHRGIATRSFERRFDLADHITVVGATLENGLLNVDLVREIPEEKKPRRIAILSGDAKAIEQKAA